MEAIVVLITCATEEEAAKIAEALVKERLAACVNRLSGVSSFFRWQGKLETAQEVLLVAKSNKTEFGKIEHRVKQLHSYEVPEIIALPVVAGHQPYLNWIDESLRHSD